MILKHLRNVVFHTQAYTLTFWKAVYMTPQIGPKPWKKRSLPNEKQLSFRRDIVENTADTPDLEP